jgi:hypothetical protein
MRRTYVQERFVVAYVWRGTLFATASMDEGSARWLALELERGFRGDPCGDIRVERV